MQNSLQTYTQKYDENNYGLLYPDSHAIRFYERILKYKLGITSGNLLDFGCGNGVHSKYFLDKGFKPFGIDIVPSLQKNWDAKIKISGGGDCKIIEPNSSIKGLFDEKMDIVFANQSLYYIPKTELKQNILEFYECLNQGGILFATMMSEKNYYFSHSEKENENGLRKVSIQGRLNETTYIHFTKSIDELQELFKPFEALFLGDYDPINFYNFEGSAHHFIYIGIKR
ncbi:class I SAM-dependent methyltransferase [Campylobacter jejuni]|nr:class I SAM-dependent methyltransferase [Campylobacter jejuni]EAI8158611.1 class I SAM-dependent methyltransferase [Campylobacter jejuni]EAJ6020251.1 class I SAM-dependent methyltransferase [Campylobacter jejuni]EAJ7171418.1 class I SAM-dependent methyltransferase [Campylobacter jejuni]EAJ8933745.1 class I SAM-dependent methyltransferase [Campylobacter jejuni]